MGWATARAALLLAAGALALVALAGHASAATKDVTIQSSTFSPNAVEVNVGDTVRWTNNDGFAHTATSSGNWDTGTIQGQGGARSLTMQNSGTYDYFCSIHPSMRGSVHVLAPAENGHPSIMITSPPTGSTVSNIAQIIGMVNDPDPNDVLSVSLKIDNEQFRSVPRNGSSWTFSWDTRGVNNGAHTITARVSDGALTTTTAVSLTVNNVPTIAIVGPEDGASAKVGSTIHITGKASAPQGVSITVQVSIDGAEWANVSGRNLWEYVWDTSGLAPGNHTFQARVIDAINEIHSDLRILTLLEPPPDQPPLLSIVSPGEGASVSGLVNISGTASDPEGAPTDVQVNIDSAGWRPVTGRAGETWWYHWVPEGRASGAFTILARVTADNVTIALTRQATLTESPTPLTLQRLTERPRAGQDFVVRVLSPETNNSSVASARLYLSGADGLTVAERTTNASGFATFSGVREGSYRLRAFSAGASGTLVVNVTGLYDYSVSPTRVDYDFVRPVVVSVRSSATIRGIDIDLRGPILPNNISGTARTGNDGLAIVGLQPLAAGELSVFANGNDTGLRVQVAPTVLVEWSPPEPQPGEALTATFTFNDLARTRVVHTNVSVDLPGEKRVEMHTDGLGRLRLEPELAGTLRVFVKRDDMRSVVHELAIQPPPATPELSELVTRAGPGILQMSVVVKNAGEGPGVFTLDGLATSTAGILAQQTARTKELAPGEQTRVLMAVNVGQGEYAILVSVRNSAATITGKGQVVESGVPPTPVGPAQEPPPTPPRQEEEKNSPNATVGMLVALVSVAALLRRRVLL